jgi:hypothetical protein
MMSLMKRTQTENSTTKRRGYRFWPIRIAIFLGLPLLLYFGYCWGVWGRHSLLPQYLFQCSCPPASEEARYPEEVDVIIPACRNIDVTTRLSPSGRFLYIREGNHELASAYFLDLQTMERIEVTDQPFSSFLTDDLWFVESGLEDEIIDRTNGIIYSIQTFRFWRENAYINGEPNLELLVVSLEQAERVFFTQRYNNTVVVLMSDFTTNPNRSFTFSRSDIPMGEFNSRVEQFLQENNIVYQTVREDFPTEVISPDERLVARDKGIYLVATGQKVIEGISSVRVRGWTNDGRSVIHTPYFGGPCLFRIGIPLGDDTTCFIRVSQPVLLLKVPEEYLIQTP